MSDPNDVRFARGLWHTWWPHVRDAWREFVEGRQPLEQYYDQLLEEHGADDFPAWSWDEDESDDDEEEEEEAPPEEKKKF